MGKKAAKSTVAARRAERPGPIEKFEAGAEKALPGRRLGLWLEAFLHPEKTIDAERKNATSWNILVHLVLIGLTAAIIMWVSLLISSLFVPATPMLLGIVRIFIADILIALVIGFVLSALLFLLARLCGGKGAYLEQAQGITLVYGGQILVSAVFSLLSGIPALGAIIFPILVAIGIYALYNYYLVVRHVQRISGFKTVAIIAISLLLLVAAGIMLVSAVAA